MVISRPPHQYDQKPGGDQQLEKIGADTAGNEQHFAEILTKVRDVTLTTRRGGRQGSRAAAAGA